MSSVSLMRHRISDYAAPEDHNLMIIPYFASDDADTLDIINRGSEEDLERKCISFPDPYPHDAESAMCSTHQRMDRTWVGTACKQVIQSII